MDTLTRESATERQAAFIAELSTKPEFQTIEATTHQPEPPIPDILHQLVRLTTSAAAEDEDVLNNHCYDVACSTLEIAARTPPPQQSRLLELIAQLQQVEVRDSADASRVLLYDGETVVWRELPTFGVVFADELGSFSPLDPANTPAETQRWENLTAFAAQLSAASTETDFTTWALAACSYAFDSQSEGAGAELMERAMRAAALWFVYASARIWAKIQDARLEYADWEDWNRWKQGFGGARGGFADEWTGRVVSEALGQMERVEGGR